MKADIKEFLQSVREASETMEKLQRRKEDYLDKALSLSGMSENAIRSTDRHSRTETAALMLVEIADSIDRQILGYAEIMKQFERIYNGIESAKFREILDRRYRQRQPWKVIASEMGYRDVSGVFKAHGWALLQAKKIYEKI